jgi:hypothetical protein
MTHQFSLDEVKSIIETVRTSCAESAYDHSGLIDYSTASAVCNEITRQLERAQAKKEQEALSPTLAQLRDLLTWPENWNTYNALAPNPAAVSHATQWITEVYQHLISQKQQWIAPNVTASADGAVNIAWRNSDKILEMLIDEQDIDYLQVDGKGINAPMYDGRIKSIDDIQQLWQWLLEPGQEQ